MGQFVVFAVVPYFMNFHSLLLWFTQWKCGCTVIYFHREATTKIYFYILYVYICVSGVAPCHHMFTSNKRMHAVMQNLISAICAVFLCLYAFLSHPRVPCTSASPPTTQLWSCVQERKMLEALTCNWFASTSQLSVAEVVCLNWLLPPYSPSIPPQPPPPLFFFFVFLTSEQCVSVSWSS